MKEVRIKDFDFMHQNNYFSIDANVFFELIKDTTMHEVHGSIVEEDTSYYDDPKVEDLTIYLYLHDENKYIHINRSMTTWVIELQGIFEIASIKAVNYAINALSFNIR